MVAGLTISQTSVHSWGDEVPADGGEAPTLRIRRKELLTRSGFPGTTTLLLEAIAKSQAARTLRFAVVATDLHIGDAAIAGAHRKRVLL